jgi:hypothetical protein
VKTAVHPADERRGSVEFRFGFGFESNAAREKVRRGRLG